MSASDETAWVALSEAAGATGLGVSTLRRLAAETALPARRRPHGWEVRIADVEAYRRATRRDAGRPPQSDIRHEGPGRWRVLCDGVGWRFSARLRGRERRVSFEVWLSRQLVTILEEDGYPVLELVTDAAPVLFESLVLAGDPNGGAQLISELKFGDRERLLRVAGWTNDFAFAGGSAPEGDGVPVRSWYGHREGPWIRGDTLKESGHPAACVVVDARPTRSSMAVTMVRVYDLRQPCLRVEALKSALAAYERWRQPRALPIPPWVERVEELIRQKVTPSR